MVVRRGRNHKPPTGCWSPNTHQCVKATKIFPSGPNQQKGYCGTSHRKCEGWLCEECVTTHSASHPAAYRSVQVQTSQSIYANPCQSSQALTMGMQALEQDLGAIAWSNESHFLLHRWMAPQCTMGRRQASGWSVMLWAILGPHLHKHRCTPLHGNSIH